MLTSVTLLISFGGSMVFSYFLEVRTSVNNTAKLHEIFRHKLIGRFLNVDKIISGHLYIPYKGHNKVEDDENPPNLIMQLDAHEISDLENALRNDLKLELSNILSGCEVNHEIFETVEYSVFGDSDPSIRIASISYVVRYYEPIENVRKFVDYYLKNHPQIEKKLPRICNILCYVPVHWEDPIGLSKSKCIVGNEVVFRSVEDFAKALESPARAELRRDILNCPVSPGPSTHFIMERDDFF